MYKKWGLQLKGEAQKINGYVQKEWDLHLKGGP